MDQKTRIRINQITEIVSHYPNAAKFRKEIEDFTAKAGDSFIVGVFGEDKSGKSKLVNKLLGEKLMPVSSIPWEERVPRLAGMGLEQADYPEGLECISCSSMFSEKGMLLLDMPGFNSEGQTAVLEKQLQERCDVMIVTISAMKPLGITEQEMIISLCAERTPILFAVTFLDTVSDEEEDQQRIRDFLRERISDELLKRATTYYRNDPDTASFVRTVMGKPIIFDLLECSEEIRRDVLKTISECHENCLAERLNHFEQQLREHFEDYYSEVLGYYEQKERELFRKDFKAKYALDHFRDMMDNMIKEQSDELMKWGVGSFGNTKIAEQAIRELVVELRGKWGGARKHKEILLIEAARVVQIFVRQLSSIQIYDYKNETLRQKLAEAEAQANIYLANVTQQIRELMGLRMRNMISAIAYLTDFMEIQEIQEERIAEYVKPDLDGIRLDIMNTVGYDDLIGVDIILQVYAVIVIKLQDFTRRLQQWFVACQQMARTVAAQIEEKRIVGIMDGEHDRLNVMRNCLTAYYQEDKKVIAGWEQ